VRHKQLDEQEDHCHSRSHDRSRHPLQYGIQIDRGRDEMADEDGTPSRHRYPDAGTLQRLSFGHDEHPPEYNPDVRDGMSAKEYKPESNAQESEQNL
jgi:hypothetical protein